MSMTMQAFLLTGNVQLQEKFLADFKTEYAIPSYSVTRFQETFKIADARALKKTLAAKTHSEESRLVILENPTLDSQNALLKTIEELPERTYIFFLAQNKESLVATILSRVQCVELEKTEIIASEKLVGMFLQDDPSVQSVLQAFDTMSVTPTEEELKVYIVSLRQALLHKVSENKSTIPLLHYIKQVIKNYSLCETNNVNKRMIGEASL